MRNYKIAVAGTGYVGLSLGVLLSQHHQVVAVDIVQAKVDMINNKKSPIQDTKYLLTMSKFHNYSFNNTLLIAMQRPDATLVAGYNAWKNKFNRYVKKGEKGICKRKKNTTPCAYHAVPEKMLMMVAMDQIHHLVSTMCEEEKLVKDMMRGSNLDSARSIKMKEKSILFRIQEAEERRLRLYEDYKAEILDEDEYSQLKEHYIAEKQRLEHELQKQRQRALELEKRIKICDVQMERIDVNTTSVRTLPEDKWIIAENAHEAIVTKDEYYQAQKAIRNVTPIQYKVGDDFALKGKICCGNCNRQLRHERQYGEMVFYCGYKRSAGKFSKCYGGYYREYSVNAKVARAIKTVFYALDVVNQGMQEKQSITVRCMDIEDLKKQAEAIRVEQIKLYESYADGVLLRDAYIEKKKALSEKLAALQDSIRTEKEEQECADELDEEIRALTKQASEKTYIGGLTKECVDAFVSMVYLYDDQTMKIEFNCEDVIRRALEKYGA